MFRNQKSFKKIDVEEILSEKAYDMYLDSSFEVYQQENDLYRVGVTERDYEMKDMLEENVNEFFENLAFQEWLNNALELLDDGETIGLEYVDDEQLATLLRLDFVIDKTQTYLFKED